MEQGQEAKDLKRVEARGEVATVRAGKAVLRQAPEVIAFAPIVVQEQPIKWGPPVMSCIVLSAEQP